ncbi:properdin-like [Leucoraja erinacea]|uniref:properdin-like n=1 Tax=Leucoraja erinaceus TaxID=7782 RepID=UPI002454866D|nr:properdin-like [Leucoraja erinacea]
MATQPDYKPAPRHNDITAPRSGFPLPHTHCDGSLIFSPLYSPAVGEVEELDYLGHRAALPLMGSFVPWLYYSFYCSPQPRLVYLVIVCVLGITAILVSQWNPSSPSPDVGPDPSVTRALVGLVRTAIGPEDGPAADIGVAIKRPLRPSQESRADSSPLCTGYSPESEWSEWSAWSPCTVSCKEGVQQRRRVCLGSKECHGEEKLQARSCIDQPCCAVDGGWSSWTPWGPCSVTCAVGGQERHRTCTQPQPLCGGRCHGEADQRQSCNTQQICPTHGAWAPWGEWGPCTSTCRPDGPGPVPSRSHRRTCSQPAPSVIPAGQSCPGLDVDSGPCPSLPFCPVAGSWGAWSPPTPCPVTCGVGRLERHRACDSPSPRHNGHPCPGSTHDHDLCNTGQPCPVDGVWSVWGEGELL